MACSTRGQPNAARLLEALYHINEYPTRDAIEMIAQRIHTDYDTVVRWFDLRRRQEENEKQQNSSRQRQHQTHNHRPNNQNQLSNLQSHLQSFNQTGMNFVDEEDRNDDHDTDQQQQHITTSLNQQNQFADLIQQNPLAAAFSQNDPVKLLENLQKLLLLCQQPQQQMQMQNQQNQQTHQQFNAFDSPSTVNSRKGNNSSRDRGMTSTQQVLYDIEGPIQQQQINHQNSLSSFSPSSSHSEDDGLSSGGGISSGSGLYLKGTTNPPNKPIKKPTSRAFSFSEQQRQILEQLFQADNYLRPGDCKQLSDLIQVPSRNIKIWYKNRRSKKRALAKQANMAASIAIQEDEIIEEEG